MKEQHPSDGLCKKRKKLGKFVLTGIVFVSVLFWFIIYGLSDGESPPYPLSKIIADITFDWSTHYRQAVGSDNWPITWADDDHQYTSWGDGGGFGGTNSDGRVSLGVGRVEGSATNYRGFNVWGGKEPENPATFGGKSYGIISVGGVLYMWVSPGSDAANYEEAKIYWSTNHGISWKAANWAFTKADGLILPTFLQFGRNYQGARDSFVYVYAARFKAKVWSVGVKDDLRVQRPGEIDLMRVHKTKILERISYTFFGGLSAEGNPIWTEKLADRQPVFLDSNGVGWTTSVSYNPGLGRYILMTEHTESSRGNLGIFDAPEPWGPWTTVKYSKVFGDPKIEPTTFFWNFSNKWLSADGKNFTLVFTGAGQGAGNDSWNTMKGSFVMKKDASSHPDT